MAYAKSHPLIVFGAFDRHNFGDMLFAHVAERLLGEAYPGVNITFAGLAARDLRVYGGHKTEALHSLAAKWRDERIDLIHAGGEILTCDAWQAAVMLLSPADAQACIAQYDSRRDERAAYAHGMLGTSAHAPYVIGRETFPQAASIRFDAIGGASLDACDAAMRAEVLTRLRTAEAVTVRDLETQRALHAAGIDARLKPDPATLVAALFDDRIRAHADRLDLRRTCPNGYLAVQFSADFGDDATLADLAHQLDRIDLDVVLFRAGAAPWHDDIDTYARLASRLNRAKCFESLNIWDICALIAHSSGYAGSSLHGRIVAMAYGLPRVNFLHPDEPAHSGKQSAYAATWEPAGMPGAVAIGQLANALKEALAQDRAVFNQLAIKLANHDSSRYR
jgi:hypothetical protein